MPGVLTAIAAVITAIGGLIAALNAAGLIGAGATTSVASASSTSSEVSSTAAETFSSTEQSVNLSGRFAQYFQGLNTNRVIDLESGANFRILGVSQSENELFGIRFTENAEPIGGIRFRFFPSSQIFKVETVVNTDCQVIQDYSNTIAGRDKNALGNFDALELHLANRDYAFRLGYSGYIELDFQRWSQ